MAEAPINSQGTSDLQLAIKESKTANSLQTGATIAQLSMSKTPPPAPLTPSSELPGKRQRLKQAKYDFGSINVEKKRSPSKDKAVHDLSRTSLSLGKEKATKDSNAPDQISKTMIRAREIQSTLGNENPSFIKTMLRSHVTSCFWMGLPLPFCRSFLPKSDSLMVTEDENGEQCNLKFIADKFGLSAGWRKFAIGHKLLEGDVLIFQLVESFKFKIFIVRANDSKEVNGAVNVINHDAHMECLTPVQTSSKSKVRKRAGSSFLPLTNAKKKHKRSKPPTQPSSHPMDHSVVHSQIQGASPEPNPSLKEVKTFKDFHIMVNKQCIDSELPEEIRMNYYNLCVAKNEILHEGVLEGLYYKLVAGMIGETVNIANMIKNCKLTTRKEEFDVWDSCLKSFVLTGMKVGFLLDRVRTLMNLAFESEDGKRYVKAKDERNRNTQEIKILKAKLVELYESNRKIDGVIGDLKEKGEMYETEFKRKVDAPW